MFSGGHFEKAFFFRILPLGGCHCAVVLIFIIAAAWITCDKALFPSGVFGGTSWLQPKTWGFRHISGANATF